MTARRKHDVRVCLVGDVGGTHTRLALHGPTGSKPLVEAIQPSRDHATFEEIAEAFLSTSRYPHPVTALIGTAGPVRDRCAAVTNLPWKLDERRLARRLRIPRVQLGNDLVVSARGCLEVSARDMVLLTAKRPARKGENLGVLAAGTGLGEARLVWTGEHYLPLASEGGHCGFAPCSAIELELWQFLAQRYPDHVSCERVVSGAGLGALYDFFAARSGVREPRAVAELLAKDDRNAAIAELGLANAYKPASEAVDIFARIYGAEAGNVPARRTIFLEGFLAKGRFRDILATVPIAVVTDPLLGLRGALAMARALSEPPARARR